MDLMIPTDMEPGTVKSDIIAVTVMCWAIRTIRESMSYNVPDAPVRMHDAIS